MSNLYRDPRRHAFLVLFPPRRRFAIAEFFLNPPRAGVKDPERILDGARMQAQRRLENLDRYPDPHGRREESRAELKAILAQRRKGLRDRLGAQLRQRT